MRWCALLLSTLLAAGSASTATADLIALWAGDGDATDSVAGRDGTLTNGAGFDSGILGQSFRLDGSNDYVSVPDDNVWTFGSNPFTIALWVNFDAIRTGSFRQLPNVFVGHDTGGGTTNKWIFFYDDDGYPMFLNGPGNVDGVNFVRSATTFTPTIGEWHHFAVTRDSNTYTFYADGDSLGTATSSVVTPNASAPLTIGQAEGLGYLNGRLDEIRIYNEALSASQIRDLATVPEPSGLLLWCAGMAGLGLCALSSRRRRKS